MVKVILSTSVIFLVIVAVRKFFRGRVGNVFLYSLWLLFAAGLIVPMFSAVLQDITRGERGRIESPVSIMNLVKTMPFVSDETDVPVQWDVPVQQDAYIQQERGIAGGEQIGDGKKEGEKETEKRVGEETLSGRRADEGLAGDNGLFSWTEWPLPKYMLFVIWAVGTTVILLCQILPEQSFRRQLAENREEVIYQGQGLYVVEGLETPLLFRGRGLSSDIYLPKTIMGNETLVRHAILHENIHRKHGDIWWGM